MRNERGLSTLSFPALQGCTQIQVGSSPPFPSSQTPPLGVHSLPSQTLRLISLEDVTQPRPKHMAVGISDDMAEERRRSYGGGVRQAVTLDVELNFTEGKAIGS